MKMYDKLMRSLFVFLCVGFAWGIRGHYGHLIGAMFPGAMLGLVFAYVSGQKNLFGWAPLMGAVGGLSMAIGGNMSYGLLHGYAQSGPPAPWYNYAYGLGTLFLQGGSWGIYATAGLALLLDRKRIGLMEFLHLVASIFLFGWLFHWVIVDLIGFHVNPPRSDDFFGHLGGAVALVFWLRKYKFNYALRGAVIGFIGFGFAMSFGRVIANVFTFFEVPNNNWNIMEILAGACGGGLFTYFMLGYPIRKMPDDEHFPQLTCLSPVYVLGMIPLLHLVTRSDMPAIRQAMLQHMSSSMADLSVGLIYGLTALGFLLAGAWIWLYRKGRKESMWFGVLALAFVISMMDLLMRSYFFYPRDPQRYDMRTWSMMIFVLMVLYVVVREWKYPHTPMEEKPEALEHTPWKRWTLGAVGSYLVILLIASMVNGEQTMKSANTRFPLWSSRDGEYGKSQHNPDNALPPPEKGIEVKRRN